jgi:hypothetical protein
MGGLGLLSKLPPEILEQSLDGLCIHHVHDLQDYDGECSYKPYKSPSHQYEDVIASFTGLASLCRASKHLNQLATWRLYHSLIDRKTVSGWGLLARTLIARRDLAALVRHLSADHLEELSDDSLLPPEVVSFFANQVALNPDVGLKADGLKSHLSDSDSDAPAAFLTSLCPNIVTAKFTSPGDRDHPAALGLCPPRSLQSLRDVQISHWDTENGFDLSVYTQLFRAAPNITLLRLVQADCSQPLEEEEETLKLESVTDLELLSSCMTGDELTRILRLCPNVQRLQYVCGGPLYGDEQFTPDEAVAVVREHAPKLRRFELDLRDWLGEDDWDEDDMLEAKGVLERSRAVECVFKASY